MGKLAQLPLLLWFASTAIVCGASAQVGAGAPRKGFVDLTDEILDESVLDGNPWVLVMFSPQCALPLSMSLRSTVSCRASLGR